MRRSRHEIRLEFFGMRAKHRAVQLLRGGALVVVACITALTACSHRASKRIVVTGADTLSSASPTTARTVNQGALFAVFVRPDFYPHPDLLRLNLGRINVVLRQAEHPTIAVAQPIVRISKPDGKEVGRHSGDDRGFVQLDSVPVGKYQLSVGRIGYAFVSIPVEVLAGCTLEVEAYSVVLYVGIAPAPPRIPARSTVTTCNPRAANNE